jgi:hypothetical protein
VSPAGAFAASVVAVGRLVATRRLRHPRRHAGLRLRFADGTTGRTYRETVRLCGAATRPSLLVVQFRLRLLGTNRLLHALFRIESVANTVLFAGFPGFRSKLWLAGDGTPTYRGVYDWDDPDQAAAYAEALCALLRPLCTPGSVRYHVVPGVQRDEAIRHPGRLGPEPVPPAERWWRLQAVQP